MGNDKCRTWTRECDNWAVAAGPEATAGRRGRLEQPESREQRTKGVLVEAMTRAENGRGIVTIWHRSGPGGTAGVEGTFWNSRSQVTRRLRKYWLRL